MLRTLPAIALLTSALAASAATPDHLRCYKIQDTAPKASYSADMTGLVPGLSRCTIKVPGQLLCVEAEKTNVDPAPPAVGTGPSAGRFLCYKVKCPKATAQSIMWSDQFGVRAVTPFFSKLVCAPALATTTTTSSTTSTMGGSTTTTLVPPPCTPGFEGSSCGSCGSGVCGVHCGSTGLSCVSNGSASCDTSVSCASDMNCTGGKLCISSPGAFCSEAFCCSPCP